MAFYIEDRDVTNPASTRPARVVRMFGDDRTALIEFANTYDIAYITKRGFAYIAISALARGYMMSKGAVEISSRVMDAMVRLKESGNEGGDPSTAIARLSAMPPAVASSHSLKLSELKGGKKLAAAVREAKGKRDVHRG